MGKGSGTCDRPAISIMGLSDLHLGPGANKKHYSSNWEDHQSKMRKNWDKKVGEDDIVLMPGDFSWHKDPADLEYDYYWIDRRPGFLKVLSPGNHDYGEVWASEQNAKDFVSQFKTQQAVMGGAIRIPNPFSQTGGGLVVCAAQGSQSPADQYFNSNAGASAHGKQNESVRFLQELVMLDEAIEKGRDLRKAGDDVVVMIHYPPFANAKQETAFSKMISNSGAKLCLYGHLHQKEQFRKTIQGEVDGVEYRFVGADFLKFSPTKVAEWSAKDGFQVSALEFDGKKEWPAPKETSSYSGSYSSSGTSKPSSKNSDQKYIKDSKGNDLKCSKCDKKFVMGETVEWKGKSAYHKKCPSTQSSFASVDPNWDKDNKNKKSSMPLDKCVKCGKDVGPGKPWKWVNKKVSGDKICKSCG